MQAYVDELSSALIERYKLYLQTFLLDLWSERGMIEFRFGYSLRNDSKLHTRTFTVGAQEALTIAEIEEHIDETISCTLLELN